MLEASNPFEQFTWWVKAIGVAALIGAGISGFVVGLFKDRGTERLKKGIDRLTSEIAPAEGDESEPHLREQIATYAAAVQKVQTDMYSLFGQLDRRMSNQDERLALIDRRIINMDNTMNLLINELKAKPRRSTKS